MTATEPVVLCILDGWGLREPAPDNAVSLARTPAFDAIWAECPHASLTAHGPAVGLPEGQMGNSEVGHMTIGAGRVVWMDLPRIDQAIADGSFSANPRLGAFIAALKASGGTAHLAGLASPGGVHAHQRHMIEAARIIAAAGIPVALHAFTDGRDVPPQSAHEQIAELAAALPEGARIATVIGRYYAMDRDRRWDRVRRAWAAMVEAEGRGAFSAREAVVGAYDRGETDEFIKPTVLPGHRGIRDGDGLMFLNFRADRAREILSAILDPEFDGFPRPRLPRLAAALGMVEYSPRLNALMPAMFPAEEIRNCLGEWVAAQGLAQFRLAETEKYPHVTFFLNGGREAPFPGEARHMAPSPAVATYDLAPEMAAAEVTETLVATIRARAHRLIVVNYANPDMVGHTGDLKAAIAACEAVDRGLAAALAALRETGGTMLVTADHGNCEQMIDPATGGPHTAHTLNPVPCVLVGGPAGARLRPQGQLADIAPTLLALMGLAQPPEMTGTSLLA
ncbi:MAG: 2,3-bisphosphoglycerate-independent phosphoglycerate mutase [Paracoccaceae bacterium]|nr:MAG: 2,3-bisphosphoglycerate-independent phosphoglycerate mutase [Paracoccaceae bacterium]